MFKNSNTAVILDLFEKYVVENHVNDLIEIMKKEDPEKHYGVIINFILLFEKCIELGHGILSNAIELVPVLDKKLVSAQKIILQNISEDVRNSCIVKTNVHVRMTGLPACPELHRTTLPRNQDVGSFLRLSGTVTRITAPKMLEYRRDYVCSKCKNISRVQFEYEVYYTPTPPVKCMNSEGCPGSKMSEVKIIDQINYKDYQEIKIQEQVSKLSVGTVPQSMWATLEDDLVDSCKPGDDVVICGTVMRRWKLSVSVGSRHNIDICIRVSHLSVSNDQRTSVLITKETISKFQNFWYELGVTSLVARDLIIASICPQVYGLYLVKLALAIVLAGGVAKKESVGCRIRGEPHLLLVGDPGTGKSHLIRFATRICPRSVHTTGVGSTSAGLTVSAVHEHGEWQLEAGALVLADGGICCIDEFNSIKEHDRTTIHEAMEQQTISVAKAGVVCKLNTRCSIIAATNPKGHYDPNIPLTVNISLASPLLSRFDLVLILLDSRNPEWDRIISNFILNEKEAFKKNENTSLWNTEKLQEYFSVIKSLNPELTQDANTVLRTYYQAQRKADFRNAARTTVRLLESLIRLSQGHARIMFREEVLVQDAIVAIYLIESSMQGTALIGDIDTLHTTFPIDPLVEYRKQARLVLEKLELHEVLKKELQFIETTYKLQISRAQNLNYKYDDMDKHIQESSGFNANDKLADVLTNIRRNKKKYMFDGLMHQRKIKKPKSKVETISKIEPKPGSSKENPEKIYVKSKNKISNGSKNSTNNNNNNMESTKKCGKNNIYSVCADDSLDVSKILDFSDSEIEEQFAFKINEPSTSKCNKKRKKTNEHAKTKKVKRRNEKIIKNSLLDSSSDENENSKILFASSDSDSENAIREAVGKKNSNTTFTKSQNSFPLFSEFVANKLKQKIVCEKKVDILNVSNVSSKENYLHEVNNTESNNNLDNLLRSRVELQSNCFDLKNQKCEAIPEVVELNLKSKLLKNNDKSESSKNSPTNVKENKISKKLSDSTLKKLKKFSYSRCSSSEEKLINEISNERHDAKTPTQSTTAIKIPDCYEANNQREKETSLNVLTSPKQECSKTSRTQKTQNLFLFSIGNIEEDLNMLDDF